jgi:hypothetical protein
MRAGVVEGRAAQSGSRSTTAATISVIVLPRNACLPDSASYKTHPKDQISVRVSSSLPHACSGDMYAGVPTASIFWVRSCKVAVVDSGLTS